MKPKTIAALVVIFLLTSAAIFWTVNRAGQVCQLHDLICLWPVSFVTCVAVVLVGCMAAWMAMEALESEQPNERK